jgi:hypothetical protein
MRLQIGFDVAAQGLADIHLLSVDENFHGYVLALGMSLSLMWSGWRALATGAELRPKVRALEKNSSEPGACEGGESRSVPVPVSIAAGGATTLLTYI